MTWKVNVNYFNKLFFLSSKRSIINSQPAASTDLTTSDSDPMGNHPGQS